jgi:hypothetical protein
LAASSRSLIRNASLPTQNPRYSKVEGDISDVKINTVIQAHHVDPKNPGPAILIAMFEGDPAVDNAQIDPPILEEGHMLIQSEGFYTAEEAIWVMEHMGRMNSDVEIKGAQQETTCPARHRIDRNVYASPEE